MIGTVDLWPRAQMTRGECDEEQPRRRRITWDDLLAAQLTVIDDIGTGQLVPEEKFCDRLVDFLAASLDAEHEVIMTYNGTRRQFQDLVPLQVWDRIDKWCMWEETGGNSLRK